MQESTYERQEFVLFVLRIVLHISIPRIAVLRVDDDVISNHM